MGDQADTTRPARWLDLFALAGLAAYVDQVGGDEPAFAAIQRQADAAADALGLDASDWDSRRNAVLNAWPDMQGPLIRLAASLALSPPELFTLALAATCERRAAAAFAVEALQAPLPGGRPTLHLALELMASLFPDGSPDALLFADSALIAAGVLTLEGADVLPNRTIQLRLPLWRALTSGVCAWPDGRALQGDRQPGMPPARLDRAAAAIAEGRAGGVVLRGPPGSGRAAAALAVARRLGAAAIEIPAAVLRTDRAFATACSSANWLPVLRLDDDAPAPERCPIPVAILAGKDGAVEGDRLIELTLSPQPQAEREHLWRTALGERAGGVDTALLGAAVLYPEAITAIALSALSRAARDRREPDLADIARARLAAAPDALRRMAHPVPYQSGDGVLVQTAALQADLATLITRCRRREAAWSKLGPTLHASRTRGVRAMFSGDSGTGKTIAAAHVAAALGAPLYRSDLALLMNKYVGESEKNIGSLFDHAEAADVILLFDEADALFGRRTDGGETSERFANMLTNYLLTRIETHGGIVILTTNAKARIDAAFSRRLDQVIDFPLPGYPERLLLWRSHLGERAPSPEILERLASYCDLPGGHVRNAVLAAAAQAEGNGPIELDMIAAGLRREYAKLGRTLPAPIAAGLRVVA